MLDIQSIKKLSEQKRHKEAVSQASKLLKSNPKHIPFLACYGFVLVNAGEFTKAQKIYLQLLKSAPNNIDFLFGSAICYAMLGQFKLAEKAYLSLIEMAPHDFKYKMNYGVLLREHGDFKTSANVLKKAHLDKPEYSEILHNLAITYEQDELYEDALSTYDSVLERDSKHFRALSNQGSVYTKINALDEAEDKFNKALAINPNYHHALNNLGLVYLYKKDEEAAKAQFLKTIGIHPQDGKGYFNLSNLDNLTTEELENVIARLETLLKDQPFIPDQEQFQFALVQFYGKLKDNEKMRKYLLLGNQSVARKRVYDHHKTQQKFNIWKQVCLNASPVNHAFDDKKLIFIIGMPRSGTTLLESILASHPNITAGDELPYLNAKLDEIITTLDPKKPEIKEDQLVSIAEYYAEKSARLHQDGQWLIDKLPHNFKWAPLIKKLFPQSKILHIHRDAMDNCWSLYRANFKVSHAYCFNMKSLGQYFALYQDLMQDYQADLGDDLLSIRYEDLVQDYNGQAKRIFSFLDFDGFDFDENARGEGYFSRTASSKQVQEPISTKSLKGWRRHSDFLKPVLASLQKQQSRLGLPQYKDED